MFPWKQKEAMWSFLMLSWKVTVDSGTRPTYHFWWPEYLHYILKRTINVLFSEEKNGSRLKRKGDALGKTETDIFLSMVSEESGSNTNVREIQEGRHSVGRRTAKINNTSSISANYIGGEGGEI